MKETPITRRTLIAGAAAAAGGALIANIGDADAQQKPAARATAAAAPRRLDPTKVPGGPTTAVGTRSPFVNPQRTPVGEITGTSLAPLQDLTGTITPSDLHFTRIHAGVPAIDPAKHTLLIHGLVDRPMEFTVADLKRFPAVTRTYFIECSGKRPRGVPHAKAADDAAASRRNVQHERVDRRARLDAVPRSRECRATQNGFSPRVATRACWRAASR